MQTITNLKKEIGAISSQMVNHSLIGDGWKQYKKLEKKFHLYRKYLQYLETKPNKEFLEKERDRLTNRRNLLIDAYDAPSDERAAMMKKSEITKLKREYEKEMGIPKLRRHLSTITFLLK